MLGYNSWLLFMQKKKKNATLHTLLPHIRFEGNLPFPPEVLNKRSTFASEICME